MDKVTSILVVGVALLWFPKGLQKPLEDREVYLAFIDEIRV